MWKFRIKKLNKISSVTNLFCIDQVNLHNFQSYLYFKTMSFNCRKRIYTSVLSVAYNSSIIFSSLIHAFIDSSKIYWFFLHQDVKIVFFMYFYNFAESWCFCVINMSLILEKFVQHFSYFKGTVRELSSDPPWKDDYDRFTTVPLKTLSDQV